MTVTGPRRRTADAANEASSATSEGFRLSAGQATCLVFFLTLCVTPFAFGEHMVQALGHEAWFGPLPSLLPGTAALAAVAVLRRRLPEASILQYAPALLGRFAGWLYLALLFLLLAGGAGVNLSVFVDMQHTTLMAGLSGWLTAIVMIALAGYLAVFGPEVIARTAMAVLLFLVPGFILVFALPWLNSVPGRLWPLWPLPWDQLLSHPNTADALSVCRGFLPLLVLAPMVQGPRPLRGAFGAQVVGTGLTMLAFAIPVAVFGPALAGQLRFPLLDAVGTVAWVWLPVQRMGHLTAAVWQVVIFVVAATYLWLAAYVGGWLFCRRRWRPLVPVMGCVALLMAGPLLSDQLRSQVVIVWNWGVVGLGMAVPIGLAAAALLTRRAA